MSKHLERDLESLEREILDQSSRVEEMIAKACQALVERHVDLAADVTAREIAINAREVKIEDRSAAHRDGAED
jgi:phosphate transport system protein